MKFDRTFIEKPWGRSVLPQPFASANEHKIGEVWFSSPELLPLLVKYLFTSERLSVQVHPNDNQARDRGEVSGKTECWYILDAAPGATLGLGLNRRVSPEELTDAARSGSIEQLMQWRPVRSGDFFYVPAGTIHAIGADIALVEFQQNGGVTYRLYDYGRPRQLHLDDGIAVASREPYRDELAKWVNSGATEFLVDGEYFRFAHAVGTEAANIFVGSRRWVIPLDARVVCGEEQALPGECLLASPGVPIEAEGRVLIGAEPAGTHSPRNAIGA